MGYTADEVKETGCTSNIHPKDKELALKNALRGFDEPQFVYEYRCHKRPLCGCDEVRCIAKSH